MIFSTQLSIDVARDPDLLAQCVEAGLRMVFVGVETPNEESLAETHKRQNLHINLTDEITKILAAGMLVTCGLIVGFDHDGPDIFERQAAFIESLPVPTVGIGLLVAPHATPLYARIKAEGRLSEHNRLGGVGLFETNILPKRMSEAQLASGIRWLINRVYSPAAFGRRVENFVAVNGRRLQDAELPIFAASEIALARRLAQHGPAERRLVQLMEDLSWKRPELRVELSYILLYYCQTRYMLEQRGLWDPTLARQDAMALA